MVGYKAKEKTITSYARLIIIKTTSNNNVMLYQKPHIEVGALPSSLPFCLCAATWGAGVGSPWRLWRAFLVDNRFNKKLSASPTVVSKSKSSKRTAWMARLNIKSLYTSSTKIGKQFMSGVKLDLINGLYYVVFVVYECRGLITSRETLYTDGKWMNQETI